MLMGAMAKSAQVFLHTWLPNSMEGPTPVSGLIHAATMVTAGVYLLIRFSPVIEWSNNALLIILLVGSVTALYGGISGLLTYDLKKIIAYSTISQLGYMIAAIGLSQYNVALFHLINHAFFKAQLFLSAGAVIHAVLDDQDVRKMGGLYYFIPKTYSLMLIGSLSLIATPFLTGYFSKDLILEISYDSFRIIFIILAISAVFTVIYSIRTLLQGFLNIPLFPNTIINLIKEPTAFMYYPLLILSIFSVIFAYFSWDIILNGLDFFINPSHYFGDAEFINFSIKFICSIPTQIQLFTLTKVNTKIKILNSIYIININNWSTMYTYLNDINVIATTMYLTYSVAFILISIILLLVMIGIQDQLKN